MDELRLKKRAAGPEFEQADELVLWANDDGTLRTTDEDGTVEEVGGGGNGGSVPGIVRRLDLGIVDAALLADGPVTLYTPEAGEIVGPVYLYDVVLGAPGTTSIIGRDEQVAGDDNFPPLAGWDNDLSRDGAGITQDSTDLKQTPLTTGPVVAGFSIDGTLAGLVTPAWAAATVYAQFDHIIAAGHIWEADPGGTSGAVAPDFAGNIGGTVVDNGITWTDWGTATGAGSAHVYADVTVPAAP